MRIVTRGLGKNPPGVQGFITMGFGRRLIEQVIRLARRGRSSAQRAIRELEEVVVWAKLVRINNDRPEQDIQGKLTVKVSPVRKIAILAESLSSRTRSAWEDIKITINRYKK
jgi:hypothetical protein